MGGRFHLCGDIGGTKTLLGLANVHSGRIETLFERHYTNVAFADFAAAIKQFLDECRATAPDARAIAGVCLGVAGRVAGRQVEVANYPWRVDAEALEALLDAPVVLVNDFEAAAYGIDFLAANDVVTLQRGEPQSHGPQLVIAAGAGLGVAYRIWTGDRYVVIAGEGGHVGFAPADGVQVDLWRELRRQFGRVMVEHVVSGQGIARIYEFLRAVNAAPEAQEVRTALDAGNPAAAIAEYALAREDALSRRALDVFLECYGAAAGDHALAIAARGGVYLAGDLASKLLPRLRIGPFLPAFSGKGEQTALAARFPVYLVTNERLGLYGAARLAAQA